MKGLKSERLLIDELSFDDLEFIVELLNDDAFLRHIGDKGVRTTEDARNYLQNGPMESYRRHGFGLYLVRLATDGTRLGICGLVSRDTLEYPDLGFAFLPAYRALGYAFEAATAVVRHSRCQLGVGRILGICNPDNAGSIRLLEKAGFVFERRIRLVPEADPLNLYANEIQLADADGRPATSCEQHTVVL
jgi:RimJ/RimL family protein N-acetyltransferase